MVARHWVLWMAACLLASSAMAELKLPHVFGDHMVLQQGVAVPVWGWADPGAKVSVDFGGQSVTATADAAGEWRVDLAPLKASAEPAEFTVAAGDAALTLSDVLVGEVWLCSGQSNMEWSVAGSQNAQEEIAAADHPLIRHIKVPRRMATTPEVDFDAQWQVCTPETVGSFTAVGYFFGRYLRGELGVPVGLINSSWGGTRIEPWTPPVGFASVDELSSVASEVAMRDPRTELHKERLAAYLKTIEDWAATAREDMAFNRATAPAPAFPGELAPISSHQQPTALYNGMIHPLVPFAIKGAIWYQGESNHGEGMLYTRKTEALVYGWRKLWGTELPFYYVQIAPYQYGSELPNILAEFWEAQAAALAIPGTGMAVISDIGNLHNIHPTNKQEVGRRLGLIAMAKTYGKTGLVCSGPTFRELTLQGDSLRVAFDNVGGGLASRDGQPLTDFEIIGDECQWSPANAVIDGDSLILSAAGVKSPVAMRFAWNKLAEPNLMNREGLPASAFRAGEVPKFDYLSLNVDEASGYRLVYDLDLGKAGKEIAYDVDNHQSLALKFDRVAYFLELQKGSAPAEWVYVSMDAFTDDLGKIGVPTVASGAKFQEKVNNLNVISNVKSVVTGLGLKGGNIEFWPNNYAATNSAKIPGASSQSYDFGDQPVDPVNGYGSMQVHNYQARQTIFAVNSWHAGPNANIGIGNSEGKTQDWTFVGNGGSYSLKRLRVLVRPAK